jgi:hypothetical protein
MQSKLEKKLLYAEMFGNDTRYYWIVKGQIPVEQMHSIDWKNCEVGIKWLPFS